MEYPTAVGNGLHFIKLINYSLNLYFGWAGNSMIKVLLVDDHELVRTGIKRLLEDITDIDVLGEADFLLSSYSNLEATETRFSLDLAKKLPRNWEIGLSAYLNIFNDKTTDFLDGNVFTSTLALKRYF